jgi:hypothetical protein
MHLARLLGLVRVHEVLWGPTLPGEVSLGATVEAILGPSLPLTRLMVLGQVGGVVSLLSFLASLIELWLAHIIGVGIQIMTCSSGERL